MYILGLNAYHGDSAACIIKDGVIIAATEEERFRRLKHWAGFPTQAIQFCMREAGINFEQLDYIAVSRDPDANYYRKVWHALTHPQKLGNIINRYTNGKKVFNLSGDFKEYLGINNEQLKNKIIHVEHHRSHIASAYYASPFEESAILSIDGFGDFSSTMLAHAKGNDIRVLNKVTYPHSCGIFYTAFTQFLGFPYYGDEYKVMGLAPYGEPVYFEKLRDLAHLKPNGLFSLDQAYFNVVTKGVDMSWDKGMPNIGPLFSDKLIKTFGKPRDKNEPLTQEHKNLAASVQKMCEEIIFHALDYLYKTTSCDCICITGGVAQNSVANGKIKQRTPFKHVYIPSAGHDAGTAMGSAFYHYFDTLKNKRQEAIYSAFTGSHFSATEIVALLDAKQIKYEVAETDEQLYNIVTDQSDKCRRCGLVPGQGRIWPTRVGSPIHFSRSQQAGCKRPDQQ